MSGLSGCPAQTSIWLLPRFPARLLSPGQSRFDWACSGSDLDTYADLGRGASGFFGLAFTGAPDNLGTVRSGLSFGSEAIPSWYLLHPRPYPPVFSFRSSLFAISTSMCRQIVRSLTPMIFASWPWDISAMPFLASR